MYIVIMQYTYQSGCSWQLHRTLTLFPHACGFDTTS